MSGASASTSGTATSDRAVSAENGAPAGSDRPAAAQAEAGSPAVTDLVMRTFRLNGIFLTVGDALARPAGLTAARWQVLGAVLASPLSVAGIAREMGLARQSVQRIANLLVSHKLAAYVENPAHRRAKLLAPTEAGRRAIREIAVEQHVWARALEERVGEPQLRQAVETLDRVIAALDPTIAALTPQP
jgi:DNA-binding MarR family transcriptional regulator